MQKVGYLLHVYNLGCKDWEELVWGVPVKNKLGAGAKLLECLLHEPNDHDVTVILYNGPSVKDGVREGEYTKQFLLTKLKNLTEFSRFGQLPQSSLKLLQERAERIIVGKDIRNTLDEIHFAANAFQAESIDRITHIAAASHAPRCIQLQLVARERGWVPVEQQWSTVASDLAFSGTTAADVIVAEPPHRADDPLLGFAPTLPQVLAPFYKLSAAQQQKFLRLSEVAMHEAEEMQKRAATII